jgi:hypothetical protein
VTRLLPYRLAPVANISRLSVVWSVLLFNIVPCTAYADVNLTMNNWDALPRLQISVGNAGDCESNPIVFDGPVSKGYSRTFLGTGSNGVDVCFRRTLDPQNPGSPLDPTWTRCSSDVSCEIP